MNKEAEREITEFAEHLYNLGEFMDIKSIKGSIESFLLANHYVQLPNRPKLRQGIGDLINDCVNRNSFTSADLDQILALIKG